MHPTPLDVIHYRTWNLLRECLNVRPMTHGEPDTSATRHFGTKTLRHHTIMIPKCPETKCLVRIVLVPKCADFSSIWCRNVLRHFGTSAGVSRTMGAEVSRAGPKCLVAERTVSRCFAALRQLRQIRRSVPPDTFQSLIVSLVISRLDYGNAVLVGLPVYL